VHVRVHEPRGRQDLQLCLSAGAEEALHGWDAVVRID
jgi:hypothetical protein